MLNKKKKTSQITRNPDMKYSQHRRTFIRSSDVSGVTPITATATTTNNGGFQFALNQVAGYTDFTSLFDQYKIDKVVLDFIPISNVCNVPMNSGTANTYVPRFYTVFDYDNATSLAPTALRQYESFQCVPATERFQRTIVPRWLEPAYRSTTNAYSPTTGFIDCSYPDVQHYGLKFSFDALPATGPNSSFGYFVEATYYVTFINTI